MRREEGPSLVPREVAPEGVHGHELGARLLDGPVPVVVLAELLRRLELPEERPHVGAPAELGATRGALLRGRGVERDVDLVVHGEQRVLRRPVPLPLLRRLALGHLGHGHGRRNSARARGAPSSLELGLHEVLGRAFGRLREAEAVVCLERAPLEGGAEQAILRLRVARQELEEVAHVPRRVRRLAAYPRREEDPLDDVETAVSPRAQELGQVVAEEVAVEERLRALVREVGLHDLLEPGGVLAAHEEVELVAGKLGELRALLGLRELGPLEDERELLEDRVLRERRVEP